MGGFVETGVEFFLFLVGLVLVVLWVVDFDVLPLLEGGLKHIMYYLILSDFVMNRNNSEICYFEFIKVGLPVPVIGLFVDLLDLGNQFFLVGFPLFQGLVYEVFSFL